jgi:endonuclease/exonuclease/phosphatase family metal-dependent hydrolase
LLFVTYNIHFAVGWDGVEDIGRIAEAVRGAEPGPTVVFPPEHGAMADKRIDYCFACPALAPKICACDVDLAAQGSDHQPVWTEFAV